MKTGLGVGNIPFKVESVPLGQKRKRGRPTTAQLYNNFVNIPVMYFFKCRIFLLILFNFTRII